MMISYFCTVRREELIKAFAHLGELMSILSKPEFEENKIVSFENYEQFQKLIGKQKQYNGWFTEENVRKSISSLAENLSEEKLIQWTNSYAFNDSGKRVGIIMAGNIPLVGFHDFMCVLISGNIAVCKLSSEDQTLLPNIVELCLQNFPSLKERIVFTNAKIGEINAMIATGSDNAKLYFEQYFGKYPHIFRSNRTSLAVLDGTESNEELQLLAKDVFQYFGLGCRNVSHLLLPKGFELNRIFENFMDYGNIIHHHKYANNYDYNRAIYLMNKIPFLDNNFVLLKESKDLFSPLAVIHYHFYEDVSEIDQYLQENHDKIQAIVGKKWIYFGNSQSPNLNDYADYVDTMNFLNKIN